MAVYPALFFHFVALIPILPLISFPSDFAFCFIPSDFAFCFFSVHFVSNLTFSFIPFRFRLVFGHDLDDFADERRRPRHHFRPAQPRSPIPRIDENRLHARQNLPGERGDKGVKLKRGGGRGE